MKYLKYLLLLFLVVSCDYDLEENPPFLDDTMYSDPQAAQGARDGFYEALTTYEVQEKEFLLLTDSQV